MLLKPAAVDTGVVFIRTDLPGAQDIKAEFSNVSETILATTLGTGETKVSTIEHLISAFRGMGIDNAIVAIDGEEVPIMDGSALPFVTLIKKAGIKVQNKEKRFLAIKQEVSVSAQNEKAMLVPADDFRITYTIDYPHPVIGKQIYDMVFTYDLYEKQICAARTFGFLKDVEYLQAKGLALGGSLQNAVVMDDQRIINKEGLRFPDELVKHKILDAIGDLFLIGLPILGHFIGYKSGHRLNNLLLRELVANPNQYEIISFSGEKQVAAAV